MQGMLICIHECVHSEAEAVHFHSEDFSQPGHHSCDQPRRETCEAHNDATCRHIPLRLDVIRNPSGGSDTDLNEGIPTSDYRLVQPPHVAALFNKNFFSLPLPFGTAAFLENTILLI